MDCEYELRCLNKGKCYRCYNENLLKLPEEIKKNKGLKKRSTNYKEDESWKDLEENVAQRLNKVPSIKEARRSRASGALWFEKGDIVDDILHPECKERKGRELIGGEKSISIQRGWLEKAKEEARNTDKITCLPFRFKDDNTIYVALEFENLAELVTTLKSYMTELDIKEEELRILMEKLKKQ